MNVFGVFSTQGSQGIAALKGIESTTAATQQGVAEVRDTITLSTDAVSAADAASDIRFDKVAAIKAAIADGSYDTPEKFDIAIDRLLERIG